MQNAKLFAGLIVFILVVFAHSFAHAALTKQLSYQGRLQNASGQPVANGTYSIVFSIYNVASGGSALWTETQNVSVESGGFSAYLGSVTPLNLLFNEDYFLGIKVGSDPEMTPRLKLAIVGTSAFAFEAGKLEGKAASDFALSTHTHALSVGSAEITDGSVNASDIDAAAVQKRVTGTCAGQVMVAVNQDGTVTCEADDTGGGGGGTPLTPAATVTSITTASIVGTSLNYAREDHQHNMTSNFITDAMVAGSAGIATSKLSGTVTAIPGNGLGSLATLNTVSSAQITDSTLTFTDIAQNGCTSGQIVEWNGTAWNCGTDDVGGGGGVITNPTSTQTIIAGNSTTSPLVLKSASAPIQDIFDVQDNVGSSFMKVNSTGNVLVGNPAQMAPKLSVEDSSINPAIAAKSTGSGTALDVWKSGTSGSAGVFSITNAGNTSDLISGDTSGTGNLLKLSLSGINKFVVSKAGDVTATSFTGSGIGLTGVSASDPNAVKLNPAANQIIQPTADIIPLIIRDDAASTAFLFDIQNNAGTTLVRVNATGNVLVGNPVTTTAKVSAEETGTTNAGGVFVISNASNMNVAVYGETYGSGAGVLGVTNGTGKAIHGVVYGTSGQGGLFEIQNATNAQAAVYGITGGTGYAGNFELNNASNSQPALRVSTGGIGSAGVFLIGNASNSASLIFGNNSLGTGNLLQLQQGAVDKFVVSNGGNLTLNGSITAFNGANSTPVTSGATQQFIQLGNVCDATDGVWNVTFPTAFTGTPTVTLGQTAGLAVAVNMSSKTSTGWSASYGGDAVNGNQCFDWIAIGNK